LKVSRNKTVYQDIRAVLKLWGKFL